jgi:hypothetical protein
VRRARAALQRERREKADVAAELAQARRLLAMMHATVRTLWTVGQEYHETPLYEQVRTFMGGTHG